MVKQLNGELSLESREINQQQINSQLTVKRKFRFLQDNMPNLYLTIDIDKVFTQEEKEKRLLNIAATNRRAK